MSFVRPRTTWQSSTFRHSTRNTPRVSPSTGASSSPTSSSRIASMIRTIPSLDILTVMWAFSRQRETIVAYRRTSSTCLSQIPPRKSSPMISWWASIGWWSIECKTRRMRMTNDSISHSNLQFFAVFFFLILCTRLWKNQGQKLIGSFSFLFFDKN